MNPEVDEYLRQASPWQEQLAALRTIILAHRLTEEVKWRVPCYTFQKRNVLLVSTFKEYCALTFFKGALLPDPHGILLRPGENTQAARLLRFTKVQEIDKMAPVLNTYIDEAIEVEKAGRKVALKKRADPIPDELQIKLGANPVLKTAFEGLTAGRQRAYILYFSAPKQSKTRDSRIEKYTPRILAGKGINDCTCGLSRKLPACDGSHKQIR